MKNHIVSYLKYVLVLIALTVIYLFNNHAITLVLLILAVLVPAVSVICFFIGCGKFSAGLSFHTYFSNRGDNVRLTFSVKNDSFYPQVHVKLRFRLHHIFLDNEYEQELSMLVFPKSTKKQVLNMTLQYCGVYRAELIGYETSCLFNLAGVSRPLDAVSEIVVMPSVIELNSAVNAVNRQISEDEDISDEIGKGDDRSEIYDIREYKPGDELTTIHWKLSAKTEELMVKEFSEQYGEQFTVFLELNYENTAQMNGYYDLLYTVVGFFLSQKLRFSVSFPDAEGNLEKIPIENEEQIIQLLLRLYFEKRPVGNEEQPEGVMYVPHSGYMISCRLHSKYEGTELLLNNGNIARLYRITR